MGFKFNKRINLGKGLGINVSKSGIRPSYRSKSGSVSSKGFSVRTGIPGITYRKTFNKAKGSGCLLVFFLFLGIVLTFISCENKKREIIQSIDSIYQFEEKIRFYED